MGINGGRWPQPPSFIFLCQHSGREKWRSVGTHSCSILKWPCQGGPRLGPGTWYYSFSLSRVRSLCQNSADQAQVFRIYILPCFQQYVHQFTTNVPAYSKYIFFFKNWTLFGYNFPKYSKKPGLHTFFCKIGRQPTRLTLDFAWFFKIKRWRQRVGPFQVVYSMLLHTVKDCLNNC